MGAARPEAAEKPTRDASPTLEVAFGSQDRSHAYVLSDSNTG